MGALALASMVLIGLMVVGSVWYGPQQRDKHPATALVAPPEQKMRTVAEFSTPTRAFPEALDLSGSLTADDVPLALRAQTSAAEVSVPVRIDYQRPLPTPVANRSEEAAPVPEPFPEILLPEAGDDEWRSVPSPAAVVGTETKSLTEVISAEQKQPAAISQSLSSELLPSGNPEMPPIPAVSKPTPESRPVISVEADATVQTDPFEESLKTAEPPWFKLDERLDSIEQILQTLRDQEVRQREQIDELEALWRASQQQPEIPEPVVAALPSSIEIIRWTVSAPPAPPLRSGGGAPLAFSEALAEANGRPAVQPAVIEIKRQPAGPDRYSLRVQDAELARVLPQLADLAGLRLETPADLSGRVNLEIHQATLPQAMEALLGNSPYRIVSRPGALHVEARLPSPALR